MYFQYGPSFDITLRPRVELWATYIPSGRAAAFVAEFGLGRVGVIGPHPEAPKEWYTEGNLGLTSGLKHSLFRDFVRALVR